MRHLSRIAAALGLSLCILATAAQAQDGQMVSSDEILKQLDKKPEPAPGASRSFRGVRINATADTAPQQAQPAPAGQPAQTPEPTRDAAKTAPADKPSVTLYLYFKSGSAELADEASRKQMTAVGKALASPALAGARFEIGGHTDALGSEASNQVLSELRAAAIRDQLVKGYGLAPQNIIAIGYGKSQPVAGNDTESGRAKNRRVVVKRLE